MNDDIKTSLARVEEKLSHVSEQVNHLQSKLLNGITDRLVLVEKKVMLLEGNQSSFAKVTDLLFKIFATVASAVVLWKLFGIS
jgi:hypothetical protein